MTSAKSYDEGFNKSLPIFGGKSSAKRVLSNFYKIFYLKSKLRNFKMTGQSAKSDQTLNQDNEHYCAERLRNPVHFSSFRKKRNTNEQVLFGLLLCDFIAFHL